MGGYFSASNFLTKERILVKELRSRGMKRVLVWLRVVFIVVAEDLGSVLEARRMRVEGLVRARVRAAWYPRFRVPPVIRMVFLNDIVKGLES